MIGMLVFVLALLALLAAVAGEWALTLLALGTAAICFLMVGRYGATRR